MATTIIPLKLPQKVEFLFKPMRYKCLFGGRGSGKSHSLSKALLVKGSNETLRILCGREVQNSIKDSVHRLLCDQIDLLGMRDFYTITENEIRGQNGTLFSFVGFHHNSVANLKSYEGYDILWVEEAQSCSEKSWKVMLPTIRKPNSEIWISFNPDLEDDPTYQRFVINKPDNCISVEMNYCDNPFFPSVLDDERKYTQENFPNDYENVWLGKPRSLAEGAVFGKEIQKAYEEARIGTFDYDSTQPVFTAFDIGVRDSTSVWFGQRIGSRWRMIDYFEGTDEGAPFYVKMLKEKPYIYGGHFTPHDSRHREFATGLSPDDVFRNHGITPSETPNMPIEDRIHAGKLFIAQCEFDATRCKDGLNALKNWRWDVNNRTQMRRQTPLHNWASHGSDAYTYFAVSSKLMHTFAPVYDFSNIESEFA
jgi:phage terminase large subunit